MTQCGIASIFLATCLGMTTFAPAQDDSPKQPAAEIRTPKATDTPRINGPRIYGERPGRPFIGTRVSDPTTNSRSLCRNRRRSSAPVNSRTE